MDKRTFIKTASVLAGGAVLSRFTGCAPAHEAPAGARLTNWAGNLQYGTESVSYPETLEQVQEMVRAQTKLRPLGSRHSFSAIADSPHHLVSTSRLNEIVSLDREAHTVTVEGGIKYGELCAYLHENGYALHNLASLPHISIAGACATATHGSGVENGNLATAVSAIEFVRADGEVVALSRERDGDRFNGAVVGLGGIGVVTKVTLDLLPTFEVAQAVYRNLPMAELEGNVEEIMSAGYSVSFFTDWRNKNINQVWVKRKVENGSAGTFEPEWFGARLADRKMHPVDDQDAEPCTEQMGAPGPWYDRLPHFKMGFTPSTGEELQAEYFVPLENAFDAILAMEQLSEKISPHLYVSEIRTVAADDLWMSPCYGRASVALHTTWKPEGQTIMDLLPQVEAQLAPFNPIPHWAKLTTLPPETRQSRFERLGDFRQLLAEYDPDGKFRNEYMDRNVFGPPA